MVAHVSQEKISVKSQKVIFPQITETTDWASSMSSTFVWLPRGIKQEDMG